MAITVAYASGGTITTTESSMPGEGSGVTAVTTDGVYQLFLDLSDMIVGDELQVRIYEKVLSGSTMRIVYQQNISGELGTWGNSWVFPALVLMHGWDMTLDVIAGTTIDVDWTIKKVA
jgi:hypothetical protein